MTRIYFIRHGQSMANVENLVAGYYNAPLSSLGEQQARLTADYLADVPFSAVYASDLSRAYETGKAVADRRGLSVNPLEALREIFAGELEGRPFQEMMDGPCFAVWNDCPAEFVFPGGESMADFQKRVDAAVRGIAAAHPEETVCVATHATVIRVLECLWRGLALEHLNTISWVGNASVTVVDYDEQGIGRLVDWNVTTQLGDISTAFPEELGGNAE